MKPFQIQSIKSTSTLLAVLLMIILIAGCAAPLERKSGDFYTSDLLKTSIAIAPVAEARVASPDSLTNRRIAMAPEEIQREFAEGISEIHRAATISRVNGSAGPERSLAAARQQGSSLLIVPRIEQLMIDNMGRNGLESVAKFTDTVLFPITLAEAAITRGERAGVGNQYIPMNNVMVSMKMSLDFYRVSDGQLIYRRTYPYTGYMKVNKDEIEGARFDPSDDYRELGRAQGRFLVREFAKEIAKVEIPEVLTQLNQNPNPSQM